MDGDVYTTREKIEKKISEIEAERGKIVESAIEKAKAISEYDREIAITTLKLRNGVIKEWEGQKTDNLTATLIPKVAQGICWNECLNKEAADGMYRGVISNIEAMKSQLNGLQSINKNFE
jgi:adenine-specific DNA methylase